MASHRRCAALPERCSAERLRSSVVLDQCTAYPSCQFSMLVQCAARVHKKWRSDGSMYGVTASMYGIADSVCGVTAPMYGGTPSLYRASRPWIWVHDALFAAAPSRARATGSLCEDKQAWYHAMHRVRSTPRPLLGDTPLLSDATALAFVDASSRNVNAASLRENAAHTRRRSASIHVRARTLTREQRDSTSELPRSINLSRCPTFTGPTTRKCA